MHDLSEDGQGSKKTKKGIVVEESKQEDLLNDLFAFNDDPFTFNQITQDSSNNPKLSENSDHWFKSQPTNAPITTSNTSSPWLFDAQIQPKPQNNSQTQNFDNFFTVAPSQPSTTHATHNAINTNGVPIDLFDFGASNNNFSSNSTIKGTSGQGQARQLQKTPANNLNAESNPFGDLMEFNDWA